jgi:hypothetical protein
MWGRVTISFRPSRAGEFRVGGSSRGSERKRTGVVQRGAVNGGNMELRRVGGRSDRVAMRENAVVPVSESGGPLQGVAARHRERAA